MDSPDATSRNTVILSTCPPPTRVPACPQPLHNPFGELRNSAITASSPLLCPLSHTPRGEQQGALHHSPSAMLNHSTRAALPTGLIMVRNESRNRKRKTDPVNHTPA